MYNPCMTNLKCKDCGKDFTVPNYRSKTAKYCSKQCHGRWTANHREYDGSHAIGNKWRQGIPPANKGKTSPQKGKRVTEYIKCKCGYCGDTFERVPWIHNQSEASQYGRFCNSVCRNKFISEKKSGENSHLFVGGVNTYRGRSWTNARKKAVIRDGGTCQECSDMIGDSISVHHIKPFRFFDSEKEANHIDNLKCLCQSCHMKQEWDFLRIERLLDPSA